MAMSDNIKFFTADYRDKFVYVNKNKFTIGSFAVDFLNQYEENDNGARIAAMAFDNQILSSSLEKGYLNDYEFVKAGKEILYILDVLPNFSPFKYLDIEKEKQLICNIFTKENADFILSYFKQRAKVSMRDEGAMALDILPDGYEELSQKANTLLSRVKLLLTFYENIGKDMIKAFENLTEFVWSLDELEHYNETELLTLANKIFKTERFNVSVEYATATKGKKKMLVKRLHFRTFYSFILTDFFEGLALGHYPRQCEICETYFLMESARKQKYCTGLAPLEFTDGKEMTCRQYAAKLGRKELAKDDPIKDTYNRRCSCIRSELTRGTITYEFAETAKQLAKELKTRADYENDYSLEEYKKDMERENLYAEVRKILNE